MAACFGPTLVKYLLKVFVISNVFVIAVSAIMKFFRLANASFDNSIICLQVGARLKMFYSLLI